MNPNSVLQSYRRAMRNQSTITIRRYGGAGASRHVVAESQARARVINYKPEELVGAVLQGDRKAIVLNDPGAAVPAGKVSLATLLPLSKFTDVLVIGGSEVSIHGVDDQTRSIRGVVIALEVQVRG